MPTQDAIGYYTYRSFQHRTTGEPNEILWGEGELFLLISDEGVVSGTLAFPADCGIPEKDFMDISGQVTAWNPLSLRFVGVGRADSAIAGYETEYDGRVAHEWDPSQRLSLVGSVRRSKDPGHSQAGSTASFVAVKRDFPEPRDVPELTVDVEDLSSLREQIWNTLRLQWNSPQMTQAARSRLRGLGWGLDDPPFHPDGSLDLSNGAGEDFLYRLRQQLRQLEFSDGWKELPAPGVAQYVYRQGRDEQGLKIYTLAPEECGCMVPPGKGFLKSARGFTDHIAPLAANLRNPRVLAQLTLGAYGNLLEFTLRNYLLLRWASLANDEDCLSDFSTAHRNPIYWKIAGWVDDCVELWFQAHAGQVQRRGDWFEPGPWVLKAEPFVGPEQDEQTLKKVLEVLGPSRPGFAQTIQTQ